MMRQYFAVKFFLITIFLSLILGVACFAEDNILIAGEKSIHVASVEKSSPQINSSGLLDRQGGFLTGWLHMYDEQSAKSDETEIPPTVLSYAKQVPSDLLNSLSASGGERGLMGLAIVIALSLFSITIGYLAVYGVRSSLTKGFAKLQSIQGQEGEPWSWFIATLFRLIPKLTELCILGAVSSLCFLLLAGFIQIENKMAYQLLLGILLLSKCIVHCTQAVFSPNDSTKRPFTIRNSFAAPAATMTNTTLSLIFIALLIIRYFKELGVQEQTLSWLFIIFGTIMMFSLGYQLVRMRQQVSSILKENATKGSVKEQIAEFWLFPALFYLATCWLIWIGQEFTGTALHNGALIASILVLPIFLATSGLARNVISSVITSLNLFAENEAEIWEQHTKQDSNQGEQKTSEEKIGEVVKKAHFFFTVFLMSVLGAWLLNLWGYPLPFAQKAIKAIFESLVVIVLALICWRYTSALIARKMEESTPETKSDEDSDDEFGSPASKGRNHTLLPMVRKVVATMLIVMVALIVISSFGVNIGPLLAGAGVLGLAVGFGAQKLVSDVLSGFFFLLDDSFRVGEYIQAGSIKGSVESITLRNVLLRHHLGMLQVVPHSDLGAITNFMRGAIVVRFPLEFPYDTDIDKVRKIIKKVGQAMLTEPQFSDDFILPVKSQGVNEIANSVMIIRVKFTAKPGKQFVIRREAYRRITEALNAKGIYYAHRKVIVDFPEDRQDEASRQKALEAGAAAAMQAEQQQLEAANDKAS